MKSLFVSRKKYEREVNNKKIINEERKNLANKNIALQDENRELKEQIKELGKIQEKIERYIESNKKIKDKSKKRYSTVNTYRQCKKCGRMFKIKTSLSQRCHCDNCLSKIKREKGESK